MTPREDANIRQVCISQAMSRLASASELLDARGKHPDHVPLSCIGILLAEAGNEIHEAMTGIEIPGESMEDLEAQALAELEGEAE